MSDEDFLNYTADVAERLSKLDQLMGNRVAYSNTEFVENKDKEVVTKMNELFKVKEIYEEGNADEFQLRLNHIINIGGEKVNSIIIVQDGSVTHNATKAVIPVVFINKDVNTVITNNVFRFTLSKARTLLSELMAEASRKTDVLISRL